eukprot:TRINITY_DN4473_c0_g1_i7.p1 TRINITY_DN4473_c0_g1~~TRINITY_DN4473_c0_g1_i7.p1  ORF type:complete len:400 (-),score=85.24 TRINITY_DN4473_c0_g1_i7:112-1311(-)
MAAAFAETWGLDERSRSFLESLPDEVFDAVINNFNPPHGTRNINAKLNAFARKTAAEMGLSEVGQGAKASELEQFISRWGLDEASENLLRAQSESQMIDIMKSFDPPPSARNVNAMFCSFVRGSRGSGGGSVLDGAISKFVKQWGLDEASEQLLRGQSAEVINDVLQSFDPPPNTRNVSAVFSAFLRGGGSSIRQSSSGRLRGHVGGFVNRWGLDESCVALLQGLSPEAQDAVICSFNPGLGTQNVSAKFTSFVRGMDKAPVSSLPGYGKTGQRNSDAQVTRFIKRWGLDDVSESALLQLQSEQLKQVMQDFAPPPDTHNINAKLMSFLKSVVTGAGKAAKADAIIDFANHWELDSGAIIAVQSLSPWIQDEVMRDFDPPPGTKNVSGKLMAFIKQRAR